MQSDVDVDSGFRLDGFRDDDLEISLWILSYTWTRFAVTFPIRDLYKLIVALFAELDDCHNFDWSKILDSHGALPKSNILLLKHSFNSVAICNFDSISNFKAWKINYWIYLFGLWVDQRRSVSLKTWGEGVLKYVRKVRFSIGKGPPSSTVHNGVDKYQ